MTLSDYDERTVLHIAASDNQDHIADYLLSNEKFREIIKDKKDRYCLHNLPTSLLSPL